MKHKHCLKMKYIRPCVKLSGNKMTIFVYCNNLFKKHICLHIKNFY